MAIFLLDANVLIALAWPDHKAHETVGRWFERHAHSGWATCPLTQLAFVRILSNPAFSPHALTPENALSVLATNLKLPGHHFWPTDIAVLDAVRDIKAALVGHRQLTDAYLVGLAIHHKGRLATLDRGIVAWGPAGAVHFIE